MQQVTKSVKTKGKTVGHVEVPQYESVEELVEHECEAEIIRLFNKMKVIDEQAKLRNQFSEGRTTKKALMKAAYNLLTVDEISKFEGDFDALQRFLQSDEMKQRVDAAQGSSSNEAEPQPVEA